MDEMMTEFCERLKSHPLIKSVGFGVINSVDGEVMLKFSEVKQLKYLSMFGMMEDVTTMRGLRGFRIPLPLIEFITLGKDR